MKAYTDLEQSKKLAKILPLESADMHYCYCFDFGELESIPTITEEDDHFVLFPKDVRCWSLAALLDVYPMLVGRDMGMYCCWQNHKKLYSKHYNNPVDACYEMIIKLHEQKLL